MHSDIKQRIIYKAGDKAFAKYKKAIALLKDPGNFNLQADQNHTKKMKRFLTLLNVLYGPFNSMNAYDHTKIMKRCFIEDDATDNLKISRHLKHVIALKEDSKVKLRGIINKVDEYTYIINEEMYK